MQLGDSHHFMCLQRELPFRVLLDIFNALMHDTLVEFAVAGIAGL